MVAETDSFTPWPPMQMSGKTIADIVLIVWEAFLL
jgi:hypothetical protein